MAYNGYRRDIEHRINGLTFAQWLAGVSTQTQQIAQVSIDDLGDFNSYDCWSSGMTVEEGAHEVLEENDFPFED